MSAPLNSLVVPVYRNADSIPELVKVVAEIGEQVPGGIEGVFVVDGSPDNSLRLLEEHLAAGELESRIVEHSRNFGSFAAIRTGLGVARGERIAVMAADLQEPPDLIVTFLQRLASGEADVVAGRRLSRSDRGDSMAKTFWRLYRRVVVREIPAGGVDVFACTSEVRDVLVSLEEVHTSLVAQLFWLGFRREVVPYHRIPSPGPSGWTLRKKFRYLSDSVFAFTDLPVRLLWLVGAVGVALGVVLGTIVLVARATGAINVPGYAATILIILLFLSLNSLGLGIIGSYVWRAYEIVKGRPGAVVRRVFDPREDDAGG